MTILFTALAGISYVIDAIGIKNIMFMSVTERTREIGLRMSTALRERYIAPVSDRSDPDQYYLRDYWYSFVFYTPGSLR